MTTSKRIKNAKETVKQAQAKTCPGREIVEVIAKISQAQEFCLVVVYVIPQD